MSLEHDKHDNKTWSRWPRSRYSPVSAITSHKITSQSLPPEASRDPCLSNRRAVTAALCPFNVVSQLPFSASQILILPSACPLATYHTPPPKKKS